MKKFERLCIVVLNLVFLAGSLVLVGWLLHRHTPLQTRTPEEYRALIEQKTSDPKLQRMFIADDTYIRSLEHLASVMRDGVLFGFASVSVLAVFNLIVIRKCLAAMKHRPNTALEPTPTAP